MPTLHKRLSRVRVRRAALLLPAALAGALVSAPPVTAQAPNAVTTQAASAVPVPAATLTRVQVPGTSPMSATAVDLAAAGYKAREFYAQGLANRYTGAESGPTPRVDAGTRDTSTTATVYRTATVLDGGHPYRTRVMVRYPKSKESFNGTLAVEWANVTVGVDFEFATAESWAYLLKKGYAVAIVSAQRVGVERAKTWSPQRYGDLSVDVNKCNLTGTAVPAGTSLCTGDPLSFDIFAQVTNALKKNAGGANAPMPGLKVKDTIAIGQSQSASRLATYYNAIQPLHNLLDGFAFWDRSGQLRSDLAVPAISVNSEGLQAMLGGGSWTTSEYTRSWDLAGSSHASLYGARYIDKISKRDQSILQEFVSTPPDGPMTFFEWINSPPAPCLHLPPFSTVRTGLVYDKAISSVRKWYRTGRPAAPSLRFEYTELGQLARDADGKVRGGIRLPQFLVPTAEQEATNGAGFPCGVSGWHRYYSAAELKAMYEKHGRYVRKVRAAIEPLARRGYVLKKDASKLIQRARRSDIAR